MQARFNESIAKASKLLFSIFIVAFILLISTTNQTFATNEIPEISAPYAILVDMDSGKTLYQQNAYTPTYPASTTKILTAILTLENCKLDDEVTASYEAVNSVYANGTTASIQSGETHTVRDLLSTMLIHSANDAAYILAEHIGGSTASFASMMNARAKELGALNTYFVNPNGLPDASHKTSAYDMALFARYAMKKFPVFREIVSTVNYSLPITPEYEELYMKENPTATSVPPRYLTTTTNHLINPARKSYYYEYATGIKTGYTSAAQNCIVASAQKDNVDLIVVIFGANGWTNLREDAVNLFEYGFSRLRAETLAPAGSVVDTITIKNGMQDANQLDVVVEDTLKATFSSTDLIEAFSPTIEINKKIKAPIQEGDVVGTITYDIYNTTYTSNLIAGNSIEERPTIITEAIKVGKNIFGVAVKIILWALAIIGILFVALVLVRAYFLTKKQRQRSFKRSMYNSRFRSR